MRELKFRVWINEAKVRVAGKEETIEKQMCPVTQLHYFEGLKLTEIGFDSEFGEIISNFPRGLPDCFELMQFTGLKDCEGREIYEGDIIESGVSKELLLKGHRGYVVFEDASFTVERRQHKVPYNHDKYLPYLDWPCEAFESCKVIGNVFEDGGLLKE